ncbi:hypothetical protein VTO73DRAFT_1956 [Trametes versicolor]
MPTVTTDGFLPFLDMMEQLKPSLVHDIHLLSRDEQWSAIHIMTYAISKIKSNLNADMPVCKLPPELLTLVFEYASFRDQRYALRNSVRKVQGHGAPATEPAYHRLLPITHVCRMWRNVALAAAHLWTCISYGRKERADTFIHRSQAAPLSITVFGATKSHLERIFGSSGSRLQRLDIGHDRRLFLPSTGVGSSRLECVTVAANSTHIDAAAFEQSVSTLKGVALCLGEGHWVPSAHFPNLTHLLLGSCFEVFVALDSHSNYHASLASMELFQRHQLQDGDWMQSLTRLECTISRDTQWVVAEGHRSGLWFKCADGLRFGRLQPMFPFGSVRALDFFAEHDYRFPLRHQHQLQDILRNTSSLASLRFPAASTKPTSSEESCTSCCALDDKLLLPLLPDGSDGHASVRCPLLTTLCIEAPLAEQLERLAPHIAEVLAARASAGVPLKSVTLRVPQRMHTGEPLRREVFDTAARYVEDLQLEFGVDGPGELATHGTYWGTELSMEAEKYWITPDGMAPRWFRSSIEDL